MQFTLLTRRAELSCFQLKRYDFVNGRAIKNHHPIPS